MARSSKKIIVKSRGDEWQRWKEHWDAKCALAGEIKLPKCGIFGCDEKVKISGNRWKCVTCGKVTTSEQELEPKDNKGIIF